MRILLFSGKGGAGKTSLAPGTSLLDPIRRGSRFLAIIDTPRRRFRLMDAAVLTDSLTRRAEGLTFCLLPATQCRQRAPMRLQSEAAVPYVSGRE